MCYITWLGCQWAGRAGSGKLAQAVPLVGDAETKQGKEARAVRSRARNVCEQTNERRRQPSHEMRGSQNSFYFAVWLLQGRDKREKGGGGVRQGGLSQSAAVGVLGRCCCIWGCCGLGTHCRGGLVAGTEVEVVVGGEGVGSVFSVCAAERTSAAGLLWVSQSGAHLGKTGVGGARVRCRMTERPG